MRRTAMVAFGVFICVLATVASAIALNPDWTAPFPPFRIAGDLYYVGTKDLASYLVTTPKTRLVRFTPPLAPDSATPERDRPGPGTFDFLGFTHYWGRTRRGGWVVKRKTAKSRLKRAFQTLSAWCRKNLHQPIEVQHQTLKQKLQGHYGYYGITGNFASLRHFREGVRGIWRRWLGRRRRAGPVTWFEFLRLEKRYRLPRARVVHSVLSGAAQS